MIQLRDNIAIYVSLEPADMRKAIDGLCALVIDVLHQAPQSGHVFIFRNKQKDKVKCLYWDRNGFVLHYKRLRKGKFKFDYDIKEGAVEITQNQLSWLLAGLEFNLMNTFSDLDYAYYY